MTTAAEILEWTSLSLGTASRSEVRRVAGLADDGGIIQADDMLTVTRDPRAHTTMTLRSALILIGCEPLPEED